MTAADLRGGGKPSLSDALGWIGSRVDDLRGAAVGRLEDVWVDPGTGAPRWLLVERGGLGAGATLLPFEDAAADGGRLWIPYERDVVLSAPEVEAGSPLTQHAEAELRRHYAMYATAAEAPRPAPLRTAPAAQPAPGAPAAERAFAQAPAAPLSALQEPVRPAAEGSYGPRPAPPVGPPQPPERHRPAPAPQPAPSSGPPPLRPVSAPDRVPPPGGVASGFSSYPPAPTGAEPGPPPRGGRAAANAAPDLAREGPTTIEIRLEGELRITGELRGLRVTEVGEPAPGPRGPDGGTAS